VNSSDSYRAALSKQLLLLTWRSLSYIMC